MTDTVYTKDNVKVGDVFTYVTEFSDGPHEILYVGDVLLFARNLKPNVSFTETTFSYEYLSRYMVKKKKTQKAEPRYLPVFKASGGGIYLGNVNYTLKGKECPSWKLNPDLIDWIEINYEKEVET